MSLPERNPNIDISVLLPVRARPGPMEQCLRTLIDTANRPGRIEVLIAFDDDDTDTIDYFVDVLAPYLDSKGVTYSAMQFKRLGYLRLNEYLNELANHSTGNWIFFWNDDAVMTTNHWDDIIRQYDIGLHCCEQRLTMSILTLSFLSYQGSGLKSQETYHHIKSTMHGPVRLGGC